MVLARSCSWLPIREACRRRAWWFSTRRLWWRARFCRWVRCCPPWSRMSRSSLTSSACPLATSLCSWTSWVSPDSTSPRQLEADCCSWTSWLRARPSSSPPQQGPVGASAGELTKAPGSDSLASEPIVMAPGSLYLPSSERSETQCLPWDIVCHFNWIESELIGRNSFLSGEGCGCRKANSSGRLTCDQNEVPCCACPLTGMTHMGCDPCRELFFHEVTISHHTCQICAEDLYSVEYYLYCKSEYSMHKRLSGCVNHCSNRFEMRPVLSHLQGCVCRSVYFRQGKGEMRVVLTWALQGVWGRGIHCIAVTPRLSSK